MYVIDHGLHQRVRGADGGVKPGVSAANPGDSAPECIESAERTIALRVTVHHAGDGGDSLVKPNLILKQMLILNIHHADPVHRIL